MTETKITALALHLTTGETDMFFQDDAQRAFDAVEIAINTDATWTEPFLYEEKAMTMRYQMCTIVNYQLPLDAEEVKPDGS